MCLPSAAPTADAPPYRPVRVRGGMPDACRGCAGASKTEIQMPPAGCQRAVSKAQACVLTAPSCHRSVRGGQGDPRGIGCGERLAQGGTPRLPRGRDWPRCPGCYGSRGSNRAAFRRQRAMSVIGWERLGQAARSGRGAADGLPSSRGPATRAKGSPPMLCGLDCSRPAGCREGAIPFTP